MLSDEEQFDGFEKGLGDLGSLCPLLDILNHKSGTDWLKLEVSDGCLHVICNHPIRKVASERLVLKSIVSVFTCLLPIVASGRRNILQLWTAVKRNVFVCIWICYTR